MNDPGQCDLCLAHDRRNTKIYKNLRSHKAKAHGIKNTTTDGDPSIMQLITLYVTRGMLRRIDDALRTGRAFNRSDFMRYAIGKELDSIEHYRVDEPTALKK